ncbi:MAG: hypothetical protein AABY18_04020 [Candidatus Thermoplasmatota archaeon]
MATRLENLDWLLLALLYVLAFSFRWDLRSAQPYIAETWHYFVARNLWHSVSNVFTFDPNAPPLDLSWFFWQRPLLALPFFPFAAHSFAAYRAAHIVLVSTVPALGAWLLRSLGVGRVAAVTAAVILAVHPILLPWGVMFLPDSLVLALILAALITAQHGRPAATAVLLWAATWVKEVAFVTALTLIVLACWRDADGRRARLWPPRLGPFARWLLPGVPLAFLPLWVSMQVPGAIFPGFRPGGSGAEMMESLFLLLWLAPIPLLGLLRPATTRFTLVALAWPAFFLLYHYTQDKAMEFWYYVLPASFTVLAAAAALDASRAGVQGPRRWAVPLLSLALVGLVGVQVFVPIESEWNQGLATPLTGRGQWDLQRVQEFELIRDDGLADLIAIPGADERSTWMALDIEVSFLYYPLSEQADRVYTLSTTRAPLDRAAFAGWQWVVENATDVTVLSVRDDLAGNVATRLAYQECSVTHWPYVLIQAKACQGAGNDIWDQYRDAAGIAESEAPGGNGTTPPS